MDAAWLGCLECPAFGIFIGEDVQNSSSFSIILSLHSAQGR